MSRINVAIPDKYHLEDVEQGVVAALYVEMLLELEQKPRVRTIILENPDGSLYTTTVVYRHPESGEVLMQFTVRH
jgi:hypothetical protein